MDFSRYSPHEKCYSENFCKVFFIVVCFNYLGIDLGMRLMGDTVTLYLTFWGTVKSVCSDQCKEIEEKNRIGKTRDLFKKIRDTIMQRWAQ